MHYLREDHYHQISSLFQAINLLDVISFSLADQDSFKCNVALLSKKEENLVWQAISLFRQKTQWEQKLCVSLQKNIPIQSGLGGGSSNAATTLWALNQLCGQEIAESTLAIWASELGSDTAFFFSEGTAFCQGRGEIVQHVEQLVHAHFWLAKPQFSLSTPLVYQNCNIEQLSHWDSLQALLDARKGKISLRNDLEHAAFYLNPNLQLIKQRLLQMGFTQVSMTGSGTTFICFGNIEAPELPGVVFYPVQFLQRNLGSWYLSQ